MISIMDAVTAWESDLLDFKKAGGTEHDEEEKKAQLLKLLPAGTAMEVIEQANEKPDSDALIAWYRARSIFRAEHSKMGDGKAHVVDPDVAVEVPPPPLPGDWEREPTEEDITKMNDEELLAFVGNGGRRKGGKAFGKGGFMQRFCGDGGKANANREPPPRTKDDLRCVNCGGTGHLI